VILRKRQNLISRSEANVGKHSLLAFYNTSVSPPGVQADL